MERTHKNRYRLSFSSSFTSHDRATQARNGQGAARHTFVQRCPRSPTIVARVRSGSKPYLLLHCSARLILAARAVRAHDRRRLDGLAHSHLQVQQLRTISELRVRDVRAEATWFV